MDFRILKDSFFTVSEIFAERQYGVENSSFERTKPRPTDALLLFTSSSAIYRSLDKSPLYVPSGALVYIPRGCIYSIENHCVYGRDTVEVLLFEFVLMKNDVMKRAQNKLSVTPRVGEYLSLGTDEITVIDLNVHLYERHFSALIDAFESPGAAPSAILKNAYAIFECIAENHGDSRSLRSSPEVIGRALELLGSVELPEHGIKGLAELCGLSVSGFEKQFKRITGMTPSAYRAECRLARVKQLLIERPELPLDRIAELCGFEEAAYLCRVFKRSCGVSPRRFALEVGR